MIPPLLSICIPTYNGARFLQVTLEALLPQARDVGSQVEVLVIDDVSPDNTPEVVEAARKYGPFRYIRNKFNLGGNNNEIGAATKHATGEYIWAWNQHCLIYPGALARVLGVLANNRHLDLFYANFRCAEFPQHWPKSAVGGYAKEFAYPANEEFNDRLIEHWHELIKGSSAVCTQSYAHIVKRGIWKEFWGDTYIKENYVDAATTYPHTYMIVCTSFHKPSYYIGAPTITIYNGAQTWGATLTRCKVYVFGLPDLIMHFSRQGLAYRQLVGAKEFSKSQLYRVALDFFREKPRNASRLTAKLLWRSLRYPYLIRPIWRGFIESESSLFARQFISAREAVTASYQYLFYRCRPARWFWSKVAK